MGDEIFFFFFFFLLFKASFSVKSSLEVRRVHVHLARYQVKEDYKTGQRAVLQTKISWIKAEHSFSPQFSFFRYFIFEKNGIWREHRIENHNASVQVRG